MLKSCVTAAHQARPRYVNNGVIAIFERSFCRVSLRSEIHLFQSILNKLKILLHFSIRMRAAVRRCFKPPYGFVGKKIVNRSR